MLTISRRQIEQDRERFTSKQHTIVPHRDSRKRWLVEYLGGECVYCGYSKCLAALHFHHIDATKKNYSISSVLSQWHMSPKVWRQIIDEVDQCQLLCANCHVEVHNS